MTTEFRDAILATIAYHDVLGLPLTRFEIERYLIRVPSSFGSARDKLRGESRDPCLSGGQASVARPAGGRFQDDELGAEIDRDIGYVLEQLGRAQQLSCLNGFWCLPGREHLIPERIEKHKLAETKWKVLQRWGRALAYVPFVRLVLVSGSLAFHNAHPSSDLDVLVVARHGRIWTVRFLSSVMLGLFGVRRRKGKVNDRICLNHFITDQSLCVPHSSLYNAQTYARLFPLLELGVSHRAFVAANMWIGEYLHHALAVSTLPSPKQLREPFGARPVLGALEWVLGGRLGNALERALRSVQGRRIKADPRSFESGGRVVATDDELEFHPASPESAVIAAYHERLGKLGMPHLVRPGDSSLPR